MSTGLEICSARGLYGTETHPCERLYWEHVGEVTDTPSNQALHEYAIAEALVLGTYCRQLRRFVDVSIITQTALLLFIPFHYFPQVRKM